MEEAEFLKFYTNCSQGDKVGTVRENLRAFGYRHDLKKWADIEADTQLPPEDLPRLILSRDDEMFNIFFDLLMIDELDDRTWELIQMLCTNKQTHDMVLSLSLDKEEESYDWAKFFEMAHNYKRLYILQIL